MPGLLRRHAVLHELRAHVLDEDLKVDLLLVVAAKRHPLLLADDRHDGLAVELRVVQAVEEKDRAGTRRRHAHADLVSQLGVRGRRERGDLLATSLDELDAVADKVLNAGERVAMLISQGAGHAADEVVEVADVLGAGVAKALNGRDALPDDLPFVTGSIGLLGTKPTNEMIEGCDTLLMVGSSFPYSEWLPEEGQARRVQIDIDARLVGIRHPMEVDLGGDSSATLRALLPHLRRKEDRSWRQSIEENVDRWCQILDDRAGLDALPINPQLVFHESPSACPIAPSSRPTRGRRRTGGHATSSSAPA